MVSGTGSETADEPGGVGTQWLNDIASILHQEAQRQVAAFAEPRSLTSQALTYTVEFDPRDDEVMTLKIWDAACFLPRCVAQVYYRMDTDAGAIRLRLIESATWLESGRSG